MQHILIVEDDLDIQDHFKKLFCKKSDMKLRLQVMAWRLLHCFHPLILT